MKLTQEHKILAVHLWGHKDNLTCLKFLIIYDKSYQHTTIYDSYDVELAAKTIQSIKFENTSSTYRLTGKLLFDLEREVMMIVVPL